MANVVLIEDDQRIRQALAGRLAERGHAVATAGRGLEGLDLLMNDAPDVVVLDLGLPDIDGTELIKMIRAVSTVPVLVATARDDEALIVNMLDAGADDYVVKPFSGEQLDARIRAVLRRAGDDDNGDEYRVGDLHISPRRRTASLGETSLDLTKKQFDLLAYLAEHAGRVVSKRELLAEVWRQPLGGADKTVDVHLSWLRKALGESAAEPRYLHTVRGVGVKLIDPNA